MKKSLFYTCLVTFLFLFNGLGIYGQTGSLIGLVLSEDGPLPFATVSIKGSDIGVTTETNGAYEVLNLEPGTYTIIVSFVGYLNTKKQVTITPGQITRHDFPS